MLPSPTSNTECLATDDPDVYILITRDPAVVGGDLQNRLAQLDSEAGIQTFVACVAQW